MSSLISINKLERQRALTLTKLQNIHRMIQGSYGLAYRRCGKPTCWCAKDKKGHPYHRITWTKDAQPGARAIPPQDVSWIKEMTGNYRRYQELIIVLREKYQKLKMLLNMRKNEIILRTKKQRKYL